MKRTSICLIIFMAIACFGGSFNCHSGDVDVHSDPQNPHK